MNFILRLCGIALILGLTGGAFAADKTVMNTDQEKLTICKAYYVGDLVKAMPKLDANGQPIPAPSILSVVSTENGYEWRETVPVDKTDPSAVAVEGGPDFVPLVDLIKTVIAPDSWEKDGVGIVGYCANISLVIRQTGDVHAEIVELLSQLRKLNEIQIRIQFKFTPLDAELLAKGGEARTVEAPHIVVFNGQSGTVKDTAHGARLVRIEPVSGEAVDPKLAVKNEPITLLVPEGKGVSVRGVVVEDKQIRLAATIGGDAKEYTRTFYATPIVVEEKEEAIVGASPSVPFGTVNARIVIQEEEEEILTGMRSAP